MRHTTHIFYIPLENINETAMPFLMIYKTLEMFFFPILFSMVFYAADLWLLFNLPFGTTTLSLFLLAFLTGSLAAPLVGFWAIKRHGAFIISADKKGIFYKKLDDHGTLVFIDWESINTLSIGESSKKTLIIETTFNKHKKDNLPIPCNGSVFFQKSGTICLEFNISFSHKTTHVLKNLTELKRRYFINKVQPNTQ